MEQEHYMYTETENGSKVVLKTVLKQKSSAWGTGTREEYVFIDYLNDKDFELIKSLGLPNWYFDYTGRGIVLPKSNQNYVVRKQLEILKLKTPYRLSE